MADKRPYQDLEARFRDVLTIEAAAITEISQRNDLQINAICQCLHDCNGRIAVTGMGKSGHIARKLAATLASTGSPAFFLHPAEASHGDIGMLVPGDVVLMLSYSGDTQELTRLLPAFKRLDLPVVVLTAKTHSTLAGHADFIIDVSVSQEACPLGLAPTASSTAMLAVGDALAICLLEMRGFSKEDFAQTHPGGNLGKQLLLHIADIMHSGQRIPLVNDTASISDAIVEMSQKRLGLVAIGNTLDHIQGVFTDGDLRRVLESHIQTASTPVKTVMTVEPVSIGPNELATAAAAKMQNHKISVLLVKDQQQLVGVLHIQDLLQHGVL